MAILRKPLSLHRGLRFTALLIGIVVVSQPIVPAQRPGGGIAAHLEFGNPAVGVRALALFIYPDQIEALTGWQGTFFTSVDILVTGLVIGGGADGIHKIVKVFTSSFDRIVAANEGEDRRKTEPAVVRPTP